MNFAKMKNRIHKVLIAFAFCVIVLFTLVSCAKIESVSINHDKENTLVSNEGAVEDKGLQKGYNNKTATSSLTLNIATDSISTKNRLSKLELSKIKPSTAFMSYFKLDQVPVVKKYRYENLELLYNLEQYFNERFSNKIEKYFENNRDKIKNKLDKTVFWGNTNVDNFYSKYNLLQKKNIYGMPDKSIVEQLSRIDEYDFGKIDNVVLINGFTNKDLPDEDEYVSACDKLCDSIKSKNANIKIHICSLLPVASASLEPYIIEKYNNYNLKSIEINNLLSEHYKDTYIDLSFLMELGDYEFDGCITKQYSMKIISYLANYLDVKSKIIDAPMPSAKEIEYKEPEKKYIYMTFDDGPSENGELLLSILNKYDVKATMFYTGNSDKWRQNIIDFSNANQKIAAHTFTHNFKLYESEEKYFDDLYKVESLLKTLTGNFTNIVRFPGGSANTTSRNYSTGIMKKLVEDFKYMGYTYYDWNASSGDGSKNITSEEILANAKAGVEKYDNPVVLFHETHDYTVAIIEDFIKWANAKGYEFRTLDYDTLRCHQSYEKLN